jgi:hypothetical protein
MRKLITGQFDIVEYPFELCMEYTRELDSRRSDKSSLIRKITKKL